MHINIFFARRLPLAFLCCAIAAGCQTRGPQPTAALSTGERVERAAALASAAASAASTATSNQQLLTAAQLYNSSQAYAKAEEILGRIEATRLPREQRGSFLVALADARLGQGNLDGAWRALARPPEGAYAFIDELDASDLAAVGARRAALLEQRGQLAAAVRERVQVSPHLVASQRTTNEEALWTLLGRVSRESLQQQLVDDDDANVRGWAALASLVRDGGDNPGLLSARLSGWMKANPSHPAAQRPPVAVQQALRVKAEDGPTQIAILLPRHGKLATAGSVIEHGILAGWFRASTEGAPVPLLRFYDSSTADFNTLYDQAVNDGARMVLGPLDKENLKLLQARERLPVITLALNYPDAATHGAPAGPDKLYFFGLAPEDEAQQLARTAISNGHRRAIALLPAGDWGGRMGAEFARTMQENGGQLRAIASYQGNGDYSSVARSLLEIANSELRMQHIQRITGLKLGFTPKRRQDVDAIFLVGNTLQGTQMAPAIRYQHGGDIALYSTSQINSQPTATSARDLDGIRFVEMPWIADPKLPVRVEANTAWHDTDPGYQRLMAMGTDAWKISLQLPLLVQGGELPGATGTLSLDPGRRVHRRLVWMQFRNGQAAPLDGTH